MILQGENAGAVRHIHISENIGKADMRNKFALYFLFTKSLNCDMIELTLNERIYL